MTFYDSLPVISAAAGSMSISLSWQKTSLHAVSMPGDIAWMITVIDAV